MPVPMLQLIHDTITGHGQEELFRAYLDKMNKDNFHDLLVLMRRLEDLNGTVKQLLIARLQDSL